MKTFIGSTGALFRPGGARRRRRGLFSLCVALMGCSLFFQPLQAANAAAATPGAARSDGFVPFYWDAAKGRVLIEVPVFNADVLYYVSAASGGGASLLPLDRGIQNSMVIHFMRSGPKVLVVEQNLDFRAIDAAARLQNVQASFPTSVLASLPVEAEANGKVMVDATPLFIRDAAGIESRFGGLNQGIFRFDAARSGFYPARMKAFPENTEIETVSTFTVTNPGPAVRRVTPEAQTFTVRIHHSFLRAPTGYTPRVADPRIGIRYLTFKNYATPFDEGIETSWITRWRLEKQDPAAALSEPVKPIVFYFDPAIPEPVRSAMKAGALWWNKAFEAAGFRNAVQVADPTPDMDPMDIRYAWVLWIDRDQRGFSQGGGYVDPRTGEILGSKTRMDSHRLRTIANFWRNYVPGGTSTQTPQGLNDLALHRQTLLTAHELGHALGFEHNFAANHNDRSSVMDYQSPRVKVVDGKLDLSEAYQPGTGVYDASMARYAYTPFPAAAETRGLDGVIADMRAGNIIFVPTTDPRYSWYDDRDSPVDYLKETMAARKIMVEQYGLDMLKPGEAVGRLREMGLWMSYLHHRWAIESGLRYVGGMYHNFVNKGESLPATQIVPAPLQRQVLSLLMATIAPENLVLPEKLLVLLTPSPYENPEDLSSGYAFDQLKAARTLAELTIKPLLDADRADRLTALADRDPNTVTLPEVVDLLLDHTWRAPQDRDHRYQALRRVTQSVTLDAMVSLGRTAGLNPEARAYVLQSLAKLGNELAKRKGPDAIAQAFNHQAAADIQRYLANPQAGAPPPAPVTQGGPPRVSGPPGAPL